MTSLTFQFLPSKSVALEASRQPMWLQLARAFSRWRKEARDRADLAAMGYRDLQDIGFPMRAVPLRQPSQGL
jgi:uncharacterized protein YjiS (DUF1127 family)